MKLRNTLFATAIILVLSLPACVKSTGMTPTPQSQQSPFLSTPVNQPAELYISSTNAFVDSNGTYHLVGEVNNNTNTVINSIDLTVELYDSTGASMLVDETGNITPSVIAHPLLYTLAPGSSSPFDYTFETTNGTPASYNVTITAQQEGSSNSVSLQAENVQLMDDGASWFFLTGKLINTSNQWVHINALAGGILDDAGKLLSANWTSTYATELAPAGDALGRDRTPFEINFPNPGGGTQWRIFQDVNVADNVTDFALNVQVTNSYQDQYGSTHLVGWITNNSSQALDSLVVSGLYSADGTVLDAGDAYVPIPIKPGAAAPFSISTFQSMNRNPNLAPLLASSSAQFDTWFTSPPPSEFVDLIAGNESVEKDGATWIISGNFTNTSGKDLSYVTVAVMVMDAQNKLIAMEYTSISPTGDSILPGDMMAYSITIYLAPSVDTTGFTTATAVVGDVK
jgi:hypothetical protein